MTEQPHSAMPTGGTSTPAPDLLADLSRRNVADARRAGMASGAWHGGDVVAEGPLICSRKGCRAPAGWGLLWNNPKVHTPQRRKVWLACDEHRPQLEAFLSRREFFKQTVAVGDLERLTSNPGTTELDSGNGPT